VHARVAQQHRRWHAVAPGACARLQPVRGAPEGGRGVKLHDGEVHLGQWQVWQWQVWQSGTMVSGKRWQWQAVAVANVAKWQSDTVVSGGERVDGWQCVASGTVAVADVAVAIAGGVAVTKGGSGS
jgi:hypothetical protein